MISQWTIAGLGCAALISLSAPFIVFWICRKRMTLPGRNIVLGAATFVLFALVLEGSMHWYVLKLNPVTAAWMKVHGWGFAIYGASAAAIFEETGRWLAMRVFVRNVGEPGSAVSYGLGHGGAESIIVGFLGQVQAIALSVLANAGLLDRLLAGRLPHDTLVKIQNALAHADFPLVLMGGFERVWALLIQIACSLLVWRAVARKDFRWFAAALAAHFSIDSVAAAAQRGYVSIPTTEAIVTVVGLALLGLFLFRLPRKAAPA
jgi:uncharacterized membrane protein YhfC